MLNSVIEVVKTVAQVEIMPRYLKVARQRKSDGSMFTEADIASQNALVAALVKIADHPVLGEEMPFELQKELWQAGDAGLWCIDPIDGTSNFVNGLPYFAVSVALMRHGRSVLGVVYDPVADEMFYAMEGNGAFLNGIQLPIKEYIPDLCHCMAGVDFKRISSKLAQQLASAPPYSSQRNFGASTLDWCYTAAGRFDVYLHGGQKLWDYAAGSLILQEAGGVLSTLVQDDFWSDDVWQRSVVAARNADLFQAWRAWVMAAK
ncbi:phosphatase [Sulfurimicrobium lacus]|uniref:Phosphatase n=1 Tax=Sulfurimicrobium lacus TaxID=2715678 RepID=A0A6F8VIU1_9PROT|nr:inositol monophosphatase family protein [Sulfurimicrobium lacus]BCB28685.1 phosphatase [Sulfurimicrobium lacus]